MNGVSSITAIEDVALVTLVQIAADAALIAGVFSDFAQAGMNVDMISQTVSAGEKIDLSFTLPGAVLPQALDLIGKLRTTRPRLKLRVSGGNCKLRLYGEEMREMRGVAAAAIAAVAQANAELLLITTSETDISMLIPSARFSEVISVMENTFTAKAIYL